MIPIDISAEYDETTQELFNLGQEHNTLSLPRYALDWAACSNNLPLAQQFIGRVSIQNMHTALRQASARGHDTIVALILNCIQDQHTYSDALIPGALEAAAHYGQQHCVRLVLPYCAHCTTDWRFHGALDEAIATQHWECAHLIAAQTDLTFDHSSPLRGALLYKKYELAEFFYPYSDADAAREFIVQENDIDCARMVEWLDTMQVRAALEQHVGGTGVMGARRKI